jgi:hypothetical protein
LPTEPGSAPAIPLARWASRQLSELAGLTGSDRIASLDGPTLLGERGSNGNYRVGGKVSAGLGGSRLYPTRDGGWFALTLIRDEDRELLPALFQDSAIDPTDHTQIAEAVARHECRDLLARGRLLGLPVACADETPASAPVSVITRGPGRNGRASDRPLAVDLSAIWAGPLIGHLLWQAGAEVVKVESLTRPDLIRRDDPATFELINQGKGSVIVDFSSDMEKESLIRLIHKADFVIESSRPRALRQLGIDADRLVRETPGLVWLSVTGHGATGEPADWTGIGNDCGVAGGLSRALADVTGEIGYVGDAIADPLTGIAGAIAAWRAFDSGQACRISLAMSAISAMALAEEHEHDPPALVAEFAAWGRAVGQPFPNVRRRELLAPVHDLGADTQAWLPC